MKHFLGFCTVLFLIGCQSAPVLEEPEKEDEKLPPAFTWEMIEEETEHYELVYPNFTAGPEAMVTIMNRDLPSGAASFVKGVNTWVAEVEADPALEASAPWMLKADPVYQYINETFVSLQLNTYDYSGGAHGNAYYGVINYDVPANAFVTLPSLFGDSGYLTALADFVKSEVVLLKTMRDSAYAIEDDFFLEDGLKPDPANFKTFVFEDGPEGRGLKFLFAPYQLGAYAEGAFEILVPVGILSDFVKDEYRDWFVPVK